MGQSGNSFDGPRILRYYTYQDSRKQRHRFLQEWLLPWHVKDQRLLNCQSRSLLYQPLPVSSLHLRRLMLPRLELEKSPPSSRREFLEPPPPSILRKLDVSCPLETVLLVSMVSRTSRPRRWWSSAPD